MYIYLKQFHVKCLFTEKRKDHELCQHLFFLLVDDNQEDAMRTILELLGLQPGIQHDQDEVLLRLVDRLVKVIFPF